MRSLIGFVRRKAQGQATFSMVKLFALMGQFLNNMDRKAWTSLFVTIALLGFVVFMLLFGRELFGVNEQKLQDMMAGIADSPMALIGVISVFCILALTGFPQTLLFAGTSAVFGPITGALYSWIATMASGTLTFVIGSMFGGRLVDRLEKGRIASLIDLVKRHGIVTTMMIRWTPSAPFVVINSACGAARIPIWKFWLGTGIGIIPKILFVSIFTDQVTSIMDFVTTLDWRELLIIVPLVILWIAFLLFVRHLFVRFRRNHS
jgi:uncharacterized membrane protein YdjX (TVP38/TMEM64 family)